MCQSKVLGFSNVILSCWINDWDFFIKIITDINFDLPNDRENYKILRDVYNYCKIWHAKNKYWNWKNTLIEGEEEIVPICPLDYIFAENIIQGDEIWAYE